MFWFFINLNYKLKNNMMDSEGDQLIINYDNLNKSLSNFVNHDIHVYMIFFVLSNMFETFSRSFSKVNTSVLRRLTPLS